MIKKLYGKYTAYFQQFHIKNVSLCKYLKRSHISIFAYIHIHYNLTIHRIANFIVSFMRSWPNQQNFY